MIKNQVLGVSLAVIIALLLSGCGKSPSGKGNSDKSPGVQKGGEAKQEAPATTQQPDLAKPQLPKPQHVMRNTKMFANLAIMSARTMRGRSVGIDVIPGDYDAIAFGGNFVFPEEDRTISDNGPFVTVSFTREAEKSSDSGSVTLTVKRNGKTIAERALKAGESFPIELAGIKAQGDAIEWNVTGPSGETQEKDGMALTISGTKQGLVCYNVKLR